MVGALLRFNGLDWDQHPDAAEPLQMHPDERFLSIVANGADWPGSVGGYFNTETSPLNPYNIPDVNAYVYGTFPLFLSKGLATLADKGLFAPLEWIGVAVPDGDPPGAGNSYNQAVVWGRALTAFIDSLTIALVFAAGSVLFGRAVGLLAALAYALAVLPTQLAHFFTMDPYVTFTATAILLFAAISVRSEGTLNRAATCMALGTAIGLLLASKVSAAPLLAIPAAAVLIRIGLRDLPSLGLKWQGIAARPRGYWAGDIAFLSFALLIGACVFRIAQPYAFATPDFGSGPVDWPVGVARLFDLNPEWEQDIRREIDFQNGNVDFPPFVQFAGNTPLVTPLKNIVLWGLGPAMGFTVLAGAVAADVVLFKRRELALLLPLIAIAAVFGFSGPRFVAFMRYFQPIYPALAILGAWAGWAAWQWVRSMEPGKRVSPIRSRLAGREVRYPAVRAVHLRYGVQSLFVVVLLASAWWALAFQNVYREGHPRIQASEWIYENVPPGSAITHELWDDSLPYNLPGRSAGDYRIMGLSMYHPDSLEKVRELVYGAPGTEGEGLAGADYVAVTSNRVRDSVPKLEREYPATIRYYELLETGELGFDRVQTFEVRPSFLGISVDTTPAEEAFSVYDHPEVRLYEKRDDFDSDVAFALLAEAYPDRAVNLLPKQGLTNGLQFTPEKAEVQQSGGTFSEIFDGSSWGSSPAWLWWFVLLQVAALSTVPWMTWLFRALPDRGYGFSKLAGFAGLGLVTWMLVAWGVVQFSGGLVWTVLLLMVIAGGAAGYVRRRVLASDLHESWRAWVLTEAVFVVAFAAFLLMRLYNPDVWHHPQGGEKPMEMAYLTAVARSTELPPYDPWFGGGIMNYYYMGWWMLATPMRALKILPEVGFNLGIATYAAMAATVASTIVYNLVAWSSSITAKASVTRRISGRGALIAGAVGAILLMGIGNLDGGHQFIERLQAVNTWGAFEGVPVIGGAVGIVGGLWGWLVDGRVLPPFDWWRSSRVHFGQFDITEFPFWTMLFADLHPHLMGLPFFGLVIGLATTYIATVARGLRAQSWVLAVAMGLALGLVRTVHTWDFPTAVLIVAGSVATAQVLASGRWQTRWWYGFWHLAIAAGVLTVAFSPYTRNFEVFTSGVMRAPETTQFHQYLAHFGLFVAIALAYLAVRYHEELKLRDRKPGRNPALVVVLGWWELASLAAFVAGLMTLTWQFGLTTLAVSGIILFFLFNLLWLELTSPERNPARIVATLCFVLAFGIAAGVDVVTVQNDIVRMNTVFKFSLQAWQLFAIGSGFALWYIAQFLWRADGWKVSVRPGRLPAATAIAGVLAVLFFASAIFIVSGTEARQERRFGDTELTLNGLVFLRHGEYNETLGDSDAANDRLLVLADDEPLIWWLRNNVEGSPVVAEAVGPLYSWAGRISMLTGLPAVIGWDWHQIQQRWDYSHLVQERRSDTREFFTSADVELGERYLRKYNVRYVVVGTEEHAQGTAEGLAKFDTIPAMTEVFREGEYAIYEVDQAALPVPTP